MQAFIVKIFGPNGEIIGIRLIRAASLTAAQQEANQSVEQGGRAEVDPQAVDLSREGNLEIRVADLNRLGWFGDNKVEAEKLRRAGGVNTIAGTEQAPDDATLPVEPVDPLVDPTFAESPGARVQDFFSEAQLPVAAFQRGLKDAGLNPEGTFRNALQGLFGQARAGSLVQGLFDPAQQGLTSEQQEKFFQQSVAGQAGGGGAGVRRSAANAFDRVVGALGAAGEGGFGDDAQGNFLQNLTSGIGALPGANSQDERNSQIAIDLARAAASRKFSPFVAQSLLANDDQLRSRFQRGGQQGGFFSDIRRQLGVA